MNHSLLICFTETLTLLLKQQFSLQVLKNAWQCVCRITPNLRWDKRTWQHSFQALAIKSFWPVLDSCRKMLFLDSVHHLKFFWTGLGLGQRQPEDPTKRFSVIFHRMTKVESNLQKGILLYSDDGQSPQEQFNTLQRSIVRNLQIASCRIAYTWFVSAWLFMFSYLKFYSKGYINTDDKNFKET